MCSILILNAFFGNENLNCVFFRCAGKHILSLLMSRKLEEKKLELKSNII